MGWHFPPSGSAMRSAVARQLRMPAGRGGLVARAKPLVTTRISEREHRPRSLPDAISGTYARDVQPVKPLAVFPSHVKACIGRAWGLWTWDPSRPGVLMTRRVYRCASWRHAGPCARHEASVTFARMREAVSRPEYSPSGWVLLVLTLDRDGYYSGSAWHNEQVAYRELSRMSRNFLARMRRDYDGEPASAWVAVVEAHRSGWPHVNFLVYAPALATELEAQRIARVDDGATERESLLIGGKLRIAAEATGWGRQSTAEVAHSTDAIAGYLTKLAGQHDATMGEISKLTQAPLNAPVRFRRLRSGKGFLPPRHEGRYTGVLLRRRPSREGDEEICKVNPPQDPAQNEAVQAAISAEWQLIREEQDLLSKNGGELPPLPPTRYASVAGLEPLGHVPPEDPFDSS